MSASGTLPLEPARSVVSEKAEEVVDTKVHNEVST